MVPGQRLQYLMLTWELILFASWEFIRVCSMSAVVGIPVLFDKMAAMFSTVFVIFSLDP